MSTTETTVSVADGAAGRFPARGYQTKVTRGLVLDVVDVFDKAGISVPAGEPHRYADVLVLVCQIADVIAGPAR